eukprot:3327900-Rhodomonas_salina.1
MDAAGTGPGDSHGGHVGHHYGPSRHSSAHLVGGGFWNQAPRPGNAGRPRCGRSSTLPVVSHVCRP